jgi:hypothetical protein
VEGRFSTASYPDRKYCAWQPLHLPASARTRLTRGKSLSSGRGQPEEKKRYSGRIGGDSSKLWQNNAIPGRNTIYFPPVVRRKKNSFLDILSFMVKTSFCRLAGYFFHLEF